MGPLNVSSISRRRGPRYRVVHLAPLERRVEPLLPTPPSPPSFLNPCQSVVREWRVNNRQYLFRIRHGSVRRVMRNPGWERNEVTVRGQRRNDPVRIVTPEINIYRSPLHGAVASSSSRGGLSRELARARGIFCLSVSLSLVEGESEQHWETAAHYTPRHLNSSRSRDDISRRVVHELPFRMDHFRSLAGVDSVTRWDTHKRRNFNVTLLYIYVISFTREITV